MFNLMDLAIYILSEVKPKCTTLSSSALTISVARTLNLSSTETETLSMSIWAAEYYGFDDKMSENSKTTITSSTSPEQRTQLQELCRQ